MDDSRVKMSVRTALGRPGNEGITHRFFPWNFVTNSDKEISLRLDCLETGPLDHMTSYLVATGWAVPVDKRIVGRGFYSVFTKRKDEI